MSIHEEGFTQPNICFLSLVSRYHLLIIFQVVIKGEKEYYQIIVNGHAYARFKHRVRPEEVTHFRLTGDAEAKACVYQSTSVIVPPCQGS